MTAQEIFNKIWARAQTKSRSKKQGPEGFCLYRGAPNGLPCFAGACITDEEYQPRMEGTGFADMLAQRTLDSEPVFPQLQHLEEHVMLIHRAQAIHDNQHPYRWNKLLRELAEDFGLQVP